VFPAELAGARKLHIARRLLQRLEILVEHHLRETGARRGGLAQERLQLLDGRGAGGGGQDEQEEQEEQDKATHGGRSHGIGKEYRLRQPGGGQDSASVPAFRGRPRGALIAYRRADATDMRGTSPRFIDPRSPPRRAPARRGCRSSAWPTPAPRAPSARSGARRGCSRCAGAAAPARSTRAGS